MNLPIPIEGPYTEIAYEYDGTLEGLLTAIFKAYQYREHPTDVVASANLQPRLGQSVRSIETDFHLAERVARGICTTCGAKTFAFVRNAALVDSPEAGTNVYRFVRFAMKTGPVAMHNIANPLVQPLERANTFVRNESERVRQFVRFHELEGGIYFGTISPKANVVPLVMAWFAARFNTQPFIIYDEAHGLAGVYEGPAAQTGTTNVWGNKSWYLVPVDARSDLNIPPEVPREQAMQQAWKAFYQATTISVRYHPELRQHFMPQRFWKDLVELHPSLPTSAHSGITPVRSNAGMKLSSSA
ncbi:MAG: TIGR03915 family putative DNA repair protein [Coriobacteriia bacterium]|nr:TIGR03915 family putative DNA repair protein [Coriobacteriia bacterium]